ncbi:hypothetical protein G3O08_13100 [Cryomorpha ignava]|uniref:Peptidase M43 pregnancy-associated plasma-A domain-containing protein n=1 Tax=Cryomorpha ignava TaxID=101383 RepID=A0A7K3WU80_9FLAO|nr:M43 family zinc metalloprotease [Cryomorpha ignava]NEN24442.1 hypothetical protein [Cryomorpha ignava]
MKHFTILGFRSFRSLRRLTLFFSLYIITSFYSNDLIGQNFCLTTSNPRDIVLENLIQTADPDDEYVLRIYFIRVRRNDGTGGLTDAEINDVFNNLNSDFSDHGISFYWDCKIKNLDVDEFYNDFDNSIFSYFNHQNGIDIYLSGTNSPAAGGAANGTGVSSEFFVSGSFWEIPSVSLPLSSAVSHEMGHVLNLVHTHGPIPGACEELVDGSNCDICGDYVCDTPADPGLNYNVDILDCEWNVTNGTDSNLDPLNPDEKNIMSYTNVSCMEYFSNGQGLRARSSISVLPFLMDCVINSPTMANYTSGITTIDQITIFKDDVTIGNGATLEFDDTSVYFKDGVKIIVEPGGTLIANESILTSADACNGSFWHGIVVEGNFYGNQQPNGQGAYEQGRVILNNTTIKNAREGVATRAADGGFSAGGIIQAEESNFINCRRAVEFLYFENWQGNSANIIPNVSFFKKCHFEWNDEYLGDLDTDTQHSLVSLWKVDGVRFLGCTFESNGSVINGAKRAQAILGHDATIIVQGFCPSQLNPCSVAVVENEFIGFNEAIHLGNNGLSGSKIKESIFQNNLLGINLANANNAVIIQNEFIVGGHSYTTNNTEVDLAYHTAIYSSLTNQFIIEENTISKNNNSTANFTNGIVIAKSGGNSNQIYKNDFANLSSANIAVGQNIETSLQYGLKYLCNTNVGNQNDFEIRQGSEIDINQVGIARNQDDGNTGQYPTGNTFSAPDTDPNNLVHLAYESNFHYYYKYKQSDPLQIPLKPQEVGMTGNAMGDINLISTSNNNTCTSNYGPLIPDGNPSLFIQEFDGGKAEFYDLLYTYSALIDEGNTQGMVNQIALSWPQDAWQLRDELISRSPYNSETVLMEAGTRNIMPQGMLLEVLLSNPDALQSGVVIKHVQYDIINPLPQYMIDLLWLSRDEQTLRSEMEAQLRRKYSTMMKPHKKLINHYLNNMEFFKQDSAVYWIEQDNNYQGKLNQASVKASQRNYSTSISILDSIPLIFRLNYEQTEEINTLKDLYAILDNVYASSRTEMSLNQTEKDALYNIALLDAGVGSLKAAEISCFFYGNCFDYKMVPKGNRSNKIVDAKERVEGDKRINSIHSFPNPADQYVTLEYNILKSTENLHIIISDQLGHQIKAWILSGQNRGQIIWDSREFPSEIYLVKMTQGDELLDTDKIILIH